MVDIDLLRSALGYKPESGAMIWMTRPRSHFRSEGECLRWNNRYAGKAAGSKSNQGYLNTQICGVKYRTHRLAWALHYGQWPSLPIDHINGDRADNRIYNLRLATAFDNARNTKVSANSQSGFLGVTKHHNKWRANIRLCGKQRHLGLFATAEEAHAVRVAAGAGVYHENHGRRA